MNEHPIEGLMLTAMNSIEDMIDVNTIVGEPIETSNNIVIIPISKLCFGFAAGGSEFKGETIDEYTKKDKEEEIQYRLPFGGGSGAAVNISPVAFLVIQEGNVKLLPVNHSSSIDKLLDYVPDLFEKANKLLEKKMNSMCCDKPEEANKKEENEQPKKPENKNTRPKPKRNRMDRNENDYHIQYEPEDMLETDEVIEFDNLDESDY